MATNLGLYKICIHINIDQFNPKALVYDFSKPRGAEGTSSAEDPDEAGEREGQKGADPDAEAPEDCLSAAGEVAADHPDKG